MISWAQYSHLKAAAFLGINTKKSILKDSLYYTKRPLKARALLSSKDINTRR